MTRRTLLALAAATLFAAPALAQTPAPTPAAAAPTFSLVSDASGSRLVVTMPDGRTATVPATMTPAPAPTPKLQIGMNLGWVNYYSAARPFVDVFRGNAAPFWWGPANNSLTPWAAPAGLPPWTADADGYPTSALPYVHTDGQSYGVRTGVFTHNGGRYPEGQYTLDFDGSGAIQVGGNAAAKVCTQDGKAPQAFTLDVKAGSFGVVLTIAKSDPADHVRNIRLTPPGSAPAADGSPFDLGYVGKLRGFNVLRFMDWQRTNTVLSSPTAPGLRWADRTTPTSYTQGGARGVAIEYCIDLCNLLDADPWLCVPPGSDPDYSAGMAALVAARLKPNLKVYVEYGNECWNWSPPYYNAWVWIDAWAKANGGLGHPQAVGELSRRAWQPWVAALGYSRVVRVLASQQGNPTIADQEAAYLVAHADPADPNRGFDAFAPAPYFGPPGAVTAAYTAATTPHQVALDAAAGANSDAYKASLAAFVAVRDKYSKLVGRRIPIHCYEGGWGLGNQASTSPWLAAYLAAPDDPAAYDAVRANLAALEAAGYDGLNYFNFIDAPSTAGEFGVLPYQGAPDTPRYRALMDYLAGR